MNWTNTILVQTVWKRSNNATPQAEFVTLFYNLNALVEQDVSGEYKIIYDKPESPEWFGGEMVHITAIEIKPLMNENHNNNQEEGEETMVDDGNNTP